MITVSSRQTTEERCLTCSVGSRVWSGTGTLATGGTQTQLLQELRRGTKHSGETRGSARRSCRWEQRGPGALTCGADGEDHLYRVEEEEHDEQGHGGSDGQEQRLRGVDGLNTCRRGRHQPETQKTAWPHHLGHSLLFVLLLLKAPVVVGLPSLSFSWFSQSMFNDLEDGRENGFQNLL